MQTIYIFSARFDMCNFLKIFQPIYETEDTDDCVAVKIKLVKALH